MLRSPFTNRRKMNFFIKILILFTLATSIARSQTQQSEAEQLFNQFKRAARFDYTYPREKVYVHLDNLGYLVEDTIWYKAYVVRASSLKPTNLSRVLYVELLNADGQQVIQNIHKLDNMGTAQGMFSLQKPVYAGYYEIRAYTREMVNWKTEACFSRVIPVFTNSNPNKKVENEELTDITQLSIPQPSPHKGTTIANPRPYEMKEGQHAILNFYPEGGGRVSGISQKIAYKLTDGKGLALDDTLRIYNSEGILYTTSTPEYEGMGTFKLNKDFNTGHVSLSSGKMFYLEGKRSTNMPIPPCTTNYSIAANYTNEGERLTISTTHPKDLQNKLLGLAIFNRENVCYFDTLTLNDEEVDLLVPHKALRGGVCRAELFDVTGNGLSTRLFWVPTSNLEQTKCGKLTIEQNEKEYNPFSPIALKIHATDAQGRPIKGASISVAVRDESSNFVSTHDGGFKGNLLLASELRGYIHRPDLYFTIDDAAHRKMLDLLMLVQGWRANSFEIMCGKDSFELKQPIENKLIIRGELFTDTKKLNPLNKAKINLYGYRYENSKVLGEVIEGKTQTDNNGKFAFESNVNFEGNYIAKFSIKNASGKHQFSRLTLDRWFFPQPRPLWYSDLVLSIYNHNNKNSNENQTSQLFEWTDTIQRSIISISKAAEVVAKVRKYKGLNGSRYTWGGGEKNGINHTVKYINAIRALEQSRDMGQAQYLRAIDLIQLSSNNVQFDEYGVLDVENLIETFNQEPDTTYQSKKVEIFDFNSSSGKKTINQLYINGHIVATYLDNERVDINDLFNLSCTELKSICIVMDNKMNDALSGEEKRFANTTYSIYAYSNPDYYRIREGEKKGIEIRNIQGFTPKVDFYSPNYRNFDLPTEKDNRRTLLWKPQVKTDDSGNATLIFFSNSHEKQSLDISVRGITKEGLLFDWN